MYAPQSISRPTTWQVAAAGVLIILGVVVGLIVSSVIVATPRGGTTAQPGSPAGPGVSAPSALDTYQRTVASLAAAERRHDWPSMARLRMKLDGLATSETIQAVNAEHSRLLGNLAAAEQRHDQRMILTFQQQLAALCPPNGVNNAPAFCD